MIEKYQRLFQLDIYHTYFQQNICRCLAFKADSATDELMKRFRFTLRRQVNGLGLYADTRQPLPQLLNYIEQATRQNAFCFEIRTDNPYFNFFTEVPSNWVGQLLYNSSNSTVADNVVHLNQQLSGNPGTLCLGKVTLLFADILKFGAETGFASFDIRFEARATQWQYFIINHSAVPLSNPAIVSKAPINFEGPENVIMPTGQNALLFSSGGNLIPLNEAPVHQFDLVNYSAADQQRTRPQVIVKGLPTPISSWIGQATDNNSQQLSSPMYVYL